ncbi:MAG: hypothetical protein OEZ48_15385 [Candidatus Bathyarchaeota archaeon]|nr:hypothetical protein [Candidatus Bathyarchaeota archaeon]MDH5689231.1 hypothetical protein [Candidatus Bathyarchaeota archaeon]
MKREEMTRIVQSELGHLPKGDVGSPQNELRKLYNARRRHDLATNKTRRETMQFCIQEMERKHPGFVPEYDKTFFGKVDETPKKGLVQRFREWRKQGKEARAAQELLGVVAEEKERSSALESQLKAERERRSSLEIELGITKRVLAQRESGLKHLGDRIDLLEEDLKAALEAYLLSYLKESKGVISIEDCASELKIGEIQIKEALDALAKSGKIKMA